MTYMKYIRFLVRGFVLFEQRVKHSAVAEEVGDKVLSAGLVSFMGGALRCYGESTTIGVSSQPEDSEDLRLQLGAGD